eukprot:scaffold21811_cov144-Amphora_coffeaeformis.AAC.1
MGHPHPLCGCQPDALLGVTVDISVLLRYHFWQKVYFKAVEPGFPSDTKERLGHIVGISEHVGHALTWKVLDVKTNKVVHRSLCRPADESALNLRIDPPGGETSPERPLIQSKSPERPLIQSKTFDHNHEDASGETYRTTPIYSLPMRG